MKHISLNCLFFQYVNGKLIRSEFEGYIFQFLISSQDKTCLHHWNRNEYEDYLSWFYKRLQKAIDSYQETGSSFEAYINKYLLISSKEYRMRITTNSITEYSAWCARVPDLYVSEDSSDYLNDNTLKYLISEQDSKKNARRILALILKCYYFVSDDFADKIAPRIGIDSDELREMINKMRKIRQKRDDEIYLMKERIYSQFYRCIVYEKKLLYFQENTDAYKKLKLKQEKARQRLEKMRKRMAIVRKDATNDQVAEVIGIKKGTVDASLYKLKAKLKHLAEKSSLN